MCGLQDKSDSALSNVMEHLASWALCGTGSGLACATSAVMMEKPLARVVHPMLGSAG